MNTRLYNSTHINTITHIQLALSDRGGARCVKHRDQYFEGFLPNHVIYTPHTSKCDYVLLTAEAYVDLNPGGLLEWEHSTGFKNSKA